MARRKAKAKCVEPDPPDTSEEPTHQQFIKLLELPNELLAAIALQIDQHRNSNLNSLAHVCKRLQVVAQEAMLNPVDLLWNNLHLLLSTLMDRPDLATHVRHVRLPDITRHGLRLTSDPSENKAFKKHANLVTEAFGEHTWNELVLARGGGLWEKRSYFLSVLTIVAPNFHELTFEMRPLLPNTNALAMLPLGLIQALQVFGAPFSGIVMHILAKKLSVLTIVDSPPSKGLYMHNVSLVALSKLRRLSLPINALVRRNSELVDLTLALPPSLGRLQVCGCNRFTLELLSALLLQKASFPELKNLDLFFKGSLQSGFILTAYGEDQRLTDLNEAVQGLSASGVAINAFTQSYRKSSPKNDAYVVAPLRDELNACSYLLIVEISMAMLMNIPFSEIVARDANGEPRARTVFERRLFSKFGCMPLTLFTSPSFNPQKWSGVRMFNGSKGLKNSFKDKSAKSPKPAAHDHKNPKLQNQNVSPSVFKIIHVPLDGSLKSPAFDVEAWCQVEFFRTSENTVSPAVVPMAVERIVKKPSRQRILKALTKDELAEIVTLAKAWRL